MAERPHNIRSTAILDRSYANGGNHGNRVLPETRSEENQNSSYRGSHRTGSVKTDEHTAEQQRNSRVGRHHADHSEGFSDRW